MSQGGRDLESIACAPRYEGVILSVDSESSLADRSVLTVVAMSNNEINPPKGQTSPPVMTEETARRLAREGEELRRAYRRRVEAMWTISRDLRQTRAR